MDFFEFLLSYFPHRWLDRKKQGVQRLFGGLSKSLEWVDSYRQILVRNASTRTAVEIIPELESEYGLQVNPANMDLDARRLKIIAKKRERGGVVQEDDLLALIGTYGVRAYLDRPNRYSLVVHLILDNRPDGIFENIHELLESNIRAQVDYDVNYHSIIDVSANVAVVAFSKRIYHITIEVGDNEGVEVSS